MTSKIVSAVLAAVALLSVGCGGDDATPAAEQPARVEGNGVDRAFVAAMIPHHESAVEMAELARQRGRSRFVKDLAADIVRTQAAEIATMRGQDRELADAGVERGRLGVDEHMTGMNDDMTMLERADPFDSAFIEMMIPHHRGAITMAKAELAKGRDPELKALAQDIIDAQQREITLMREQQ
jgi:uncharacterized protein (DUF305 family)